MAFPVGSTPLRERRTRAFLHPNRYTTASALATILPPPTAIESFRRPSILQVLDLPALKTASTLDDKTALRSIGYDISRPSSASTVASFAHHHHQHQHQQQRPSSDHGPLQLPALTALASVASKRPAAGKDTMEDSTRNSNNREDAGRTGPTTHLSPPPPSR